MQTQPLNAAETPPAATPRRRPIPNLAVAFVVVGGVLQGIGANIERYSGSDVAWGGVGVLVGVAFSSWFARRLDWWLLLYIPAIVILMVPIALISETSTGGFVRDATNRFGDCRGWDDMVVRLDPSTASVGEYMNDRSNARNPDASDARRWSDSAAQVRAQYEDLEHPPILDRYVEFSIQVFRNYEEGFGAIANGESNRGIALVGEGDRLVPMAQAEFRAGIEECAG